MLKILTFIMALTWTAPAFALESPWVSTDYLQARLVSATDSVGQDKPIHAALEVRLAENWHAYWRMPGDGGLAPVFDWAGSQNLQNVDIGWPAPRRFITEGLHSFGYKDRISFPLTITPQIPGAAVSLNLKAAIMVCETICVPQNIEINLTLPTGDATTGRYGAVIKRLRDDLPAKGDTSSLKINSAVLGPDALVVHAYSSQGFENTDLFVESGDLYLTAPPEITPDKDDPHAALLRIAKPESIDNLAQELMGQTLTFTLTRGRHAVEKSFPF